MGVKGMECLWDTWDLNGICRSSDCLGVSGNRGTVYWYTLEIAIFLWENDDKSWDGTCLYSFFAFSTAI